MPTLLIMRHAEAAPAWASGTDLDRTLTADGEAIAESTGRLLSQLGLRPDAALCSSARRTVDTTVAVTRHSAPEVTIDADPLLYNAPASRIEHEIHELLLERQPDCLLVVGHNPGIAAIMCRYAGLSLGVSPGTLSVFRGATVESLMNLSHTRGDFVAFIQDGRVVRQDASLVGDSLHKS